MCFCYTNRLFFLIADVQNIHQTSCYSLCINGIKHISALPRITLFSQIRCGKPQIMGHKILRQHLQKKPMVHILNNTVNGTCQFPSFIKGI